MQALTLRGSAQEISTGASTLQTDLEQAPWPSTASDEFLFLRTIKVSGNRRKVAARAAEQARQLAKGAVDGWSLAAASAMGVRFRSRASLLACLIRDLLGGTGLRPWYWRRWQDLWQGPTEQALVSLMVETPLVLPTVLAHLAVTTAWQPFWRRLGGAGAEQLLAAVSQAGGWYQTVQSARARPLAGIDPYEQLVPASPRGKGLLPLDLSFLTTATPAVSIEDPRFMLGALLTLWQQAPTVLGHVAGSVQLRRLAWVIAGQPLALASHREVRPRSQALASAQLLPPHLAGLVGAGEGAGPSLPVPVRAASPATEKKCRHDDLVGPHPSVCGSIAVPQRTAKAAAAEADVRHEPFAHHFISGQGGLFYLLNFLALRAVQGQLIASSPLPAPHLQPGAGWRWLHGLASALGCPAQGELLAFLASASGCVDGAELIALPPLPQIDRLLQLGAAHYGDEVWCPATWQTPARLVATASHVDLHFRLNDVRLPVRRLGLDINPGWLPWLGRVVTFHYGSGLEPDR